MNLKADTCVCGGDGWHEARPPYVYCLKCGSLRRIILESKWTIPIDRSAEMRDAVAREEREALTRREDLSHLIETPPTPPEPFAKVPSGEWPRVRRITEASQDKSPKGGKLPPGDKDP